MDPHITSDSSAVLLPAGYVLEFQILQRLHQAGGFAILKTTERFLRTVIHSRSEHRCDYIVIIDSQTKLAVFSCAPDVELLVHRNFWVSRYSSYLEHARKADYPAFGFRAILRVLVARAQILNPGHSRSAGQSCPPGNSSQH